jgi:predicted ABC-type ATPase
VAATTPQIHVLAGVNGAGKSSIGGAAVRAAGGQYYNPDEAAARIRSANPNLSQTAANSLAWQSGKRLLERAIAERLDFAFETTLGAETMTALLIEAANDGFAVHVWYAGLESPELHIKRVAARVRVGGHNISETDIRRRYEHSRLNLIRLLPYLATLRIFDNSVEADPHVNLQPQPVLVLHVAAGVVRNFKNLANTPSWAKPIVAAALKLR